MVTSVARDKIVQKITAIRHGTSSLSTSTNIDYYMAFEDFQPYNKTKGEYI